MTSLLRPHYWTTMLGEYRTWESKDLSSSPGSTAEDALCEERGKREE